VEAVARCDLDDWRNLVLEDWYAAGSWLADLCGRLVNFA